MCIISFSCFSKLKPDWKLTSSTAAEYTQVTYWVHTAAQDCCTNVCAVSMIPKWFFVFSHQIHIYFYTWRLKLFSELQNCRKMHQIFQKESVIWLKVMRSLDCCGNTGCQHVAAAHELIWWLSFCSLSRTDLCLLVSSSGSWRLCRRCWEDFSSDGWDGSFIDLHPRDVDGETFVSEITEVPPIGTDSSGVYCLLPSLF